MYLHGEFEEIRTVQILYKSAEVLGQGIDLALSVTNATHWDLRQTLRT